MGPSTCGWIGIAGHIMIFDIETGYYMMWSQNECGVLDLCFLNWLASPYPSNMFNAVIKL